jgi:hypothetical protein
MDRRNPALNTRISTSIGLQKAYRQAPIWFSSSFVPYKSNTSRSGTLRAAWTLLGPIRNGAKEFSMKAITLAVASSLILSTAAFAAGSGPGSANNAPGQEMQQNGAKAGTTGASGYAPGHEKGATTGSTSRSGTANGTGPNDAGSGSSPGAAGLKSGAGRR